MKMKFSLQHSYFTVGNTLMDNNLTSLSKVLRLWLGGTLRGIIFGKINVHSKVLATKATFGMSNGIILLSVAIIMTCNFSSINSRLAINVVWLSNFF
jgi:hypothetical protein